MSARWAKNGPTTSPIHHYYYSYFSNITYSSMSTNLNHYHHLIEWKPKIEDKNNS